jgi:hypothetical protein
MKLQAASLGVLAALCVGLAPASGQAPDEVAKKKCKLVVKKVHGHKRKVRVCSKPKRTLPTKVSVTPDPAHAASAPITAEQGGTITAGHATLTVPAGAVADTTTVTMTPVTKIGGLPGTVLAAAQFQPEVPLLKPVTLTIDVSSTRGLKGFSYRGNGSDFRLYPLKIVGGKATLELFHFSGYGIGRALPNRSVAQLRHELNTLLEPKVLQAELHSGVFEEALSLYVDWYSDLLYLPRSQQDKFSRDINRLEASLAKGMKNFIDDLMDDCVSRHDLNVIPKVMRVASLFNDLALDIATGFGAVDYAEGKILKCTSFQIDYDFQATSSDPGATWSLHVVSSGIRLGHLGPFGSGGILEGHENVSYASYSYSSPPCSETLTDQTPTKRMDLSLIIRLSEHAPPAIELDMSSFGLTTAHLTRVCNFPGGTVTENVDDENEYVAMFACLNSGGLWIVPDSKWTFLGGATWAKAEIAGTDSCTGGEIKGTTTFTLKHVPQ